MAAGAAGARAQARPNVIVLFDDQLRADAVGAYGESSVPTPNIDRLASQGMAFDNAISTCPLCTPYRGMLLTGRYPTHSGIVLNWVDVNPREQSIARCFAEEGYDTGFIGKWHLASGRLKGATHHATTPADHQANHAGISAYVEENPEPEFVPPGRQRMGYDYWAAYNFHMNFRENSFYYRDLPEKRLYEPYETDGEVDLAMGHMDRCQRRGQPFFLTIAPHPPHPPWRDSDAPQGYLDRVPEELRWRDNVPEGYWDGRNGPRVYHSMVMNVDDNVGRIMEFLDRRGLADDTIFVFTSDHGEMMGSHGRMNKMVPYYEATRIPLIVRWPGRIPAGARSDDLFTPMDHLPTLLSLAGGSIPGATDGRDMAPVLLGGSDSREAVLMANYTSHWDYFDAGTNWPEWRGVKTKTHTYCRWLHSGVEELYHDLEDPCQLENLAYGSRDPGTLRRCRSVLKELLDEADDEFLPGTAYSEWYSPDRELIGGPLDR
jgi:arylsulfatase A-like enzyme